MQANDINRDRKPEEELDEQGQPFEGDTGGKSVLKEEHDLDDLVHSRPMGESHKKDAAIDPDDAVHQKPPSRTSKPGEADPDDLVHGS